jgi:hypothetical protein
MTTCDNCLLARLLETGIQTVAIESSHAACSGTREDPCQCGCAYSRFLACRSCGKQYALDPSGVCSDRERCHRTLSERQRKASEERDARLAADPKRKRREAPEVATTTGAAKSGTCLCGCGEKTGSWFRPGHDSRYLSSLVASVKAGTMTADEAKQSVSHSEALVSKVTKRLEK